MHPSILSIYEKLSISNYVHYLSRVAILKHNLIRRNFDKKRLFDQIFERTPIEMHEKTPHDRVIGSFIRGNTADTFENQPFHWLGLLVEDREGCFYQRRLWFVSFSFG
jgi:hypothetical protein